MNGAMLSLWEREGADNFYDLCLGELWYISQAKVKERRVRRSTSWNS